MEWPFEITDKMSSALGGIDKHLGDFEKELKKVDGELTKLDRHMKLEAAAAIKDPMKQKVAFMRIYQKDLRELTGDHKKAGGAIGEMANALEVVKNLEIAQTLFDVGRSVVELGMKFAETAIHAADFHHEATLGLEVMLGSKKAGEEELEVLERMSRGTKMTAEELFAQFQELGSFTQKFGKKATEDVIAAGQDVLVGYGQGAQQALIDVIRNAEAMGKFDERMLKGLRPVGAATPDKMVKIMAEHHGTTEKQIHAMLKAGQITAAEGINEILGLVQENVDKGGPLGAVSQKLAKGSFAIQLKNLKGRLEELFEHVDLGPLVRFTERLGQMFDPETLQGQKMRALIDRIFATLTGWLDKIDPDKIEATFDKGIDAATKFWGAIEKVIDVGNMVYDVLVRPFVAVAGWIYDANAAILGFIGNLPDLIPVGIHLVEGLWTGIKQAWSGMLNKFSDLVALLPAGIKKVLGIASPSKVFEQIGHFTGKGFEVGITASMPDISKMTDIMLPSPKFATPSFEPPGVQPSRGASGESGGSSVEKTYHFSFGDIHLGHGTPDAQHAAEEFTQRVRAEIVRFFEDDAIAN